MRATDAGCTCATLLFILTKKIMLIIEKYGNLLTTAVRNRYIDNVLIEWFEANKRILHKQTKSGVDITLKFLNENPELKDGDILFGDDEKLIVVEIKPCECIVLAPLNIHDASAICYEIGNRHLPLFFENDQLLIPFEMPVYNLLMAAGFHVVLQIRKLQHRFKTSVLPHVQLGVTGSSFTTILENTATH